MPIPTPSDPAMAALPAHVLSQTQQNICSAARNYTSPTEAAELITRSSATSATHTLANSMSNLAVGPACTPDPACFILPPPARNDFWKVRASMDRQVLRQAGSLPLEPC